MQALFTLTSSESKRLLGKAVAALRKCSRQRIMVIRHRPGSTNGFIVEELMKSKIDKERYVAGQIIKGVLCVIGPDQRNKPVTFHKGEIWPWNPVR